GTRLGVRPEWQPPLGATWTAGRVVTFLVLERWHGWQGKWWPAVAAVVLLLVGFGAAVVSPYVGAPSSGRPELGGTGSRYVGAPIAGGPAIGGTGSGGPDVGGTIVVSAGLAAVGGGVATVYTAAL